ncbi:hypothetical protein KC351_g4624 [Hortaea werneckii]|nr:hypothetical protein KC351_g4624 [Hortaea werneckii]
MDASNGQPDLQSILATLAQYANPTASSAPVPSQESDQVVGHGQMFSHNSSENTPTPPPTLSLPNQKPHDPRLLRPQSRTATASPRPMIDPASITTWPEGLRCVTKIAQQNANFAASIKKMMADQRKHEMQWYASRQNLKQTQANRRSSSAKAASILQSLGSVSQPAPGNDRSEADDQAELAEYDRKLYTAQTSMEDAMSAELKALGVPFFGTSPNLIVPDGWSVSKEQLPEDHPKWSKLITDSELLTLRKKMVSHLEDMYKD